MADRRGLFVALADRMEQQGAAGGLEREITEFIENHRAGLDRPSGNQGRAGADRDAPARRQHDLDGRRLTFGSRTTMLRGERRVTAS